jgi:formylglycine-generating enzyme required for sulfatase activity
MGDGTWGPCATESISSDFSVSKFVITNSQFGEFVSDGRYAEKSHWTRNGSWICAQELKNPERAQLPCIFDLCAVGSARMASRRVPWTKATT